MSDIREARVKGVDFKREDERGSFVEVINAGSWESLAYGRMRAGAVMGRHYHEKTRVYFFVQSGGVEIETRDVTTGAEGRFELAGGQGVLLPEMSYHEIRFRTESDYLLLKSRAYDAEDPDTFALDAET
jgi:dTDP-4-dehydrorhamnose 3,5-epimerase-like enzyme